MGRARALVARRSAPLAAAVAAAILLAGCSPSLPASVVEGSTVSIGWTGELTSLNTASRTGATPDNLDVSVMTRASFFLEASDGELAPRLDFGEVAIGDGDGFEVRYDLVDDLQWSDGVPLDASDLLLAWAAGSNALAPEGLELEDITDDAGEIAVPDDVAFFDVAQPGGLVLAAEEPTIDEFARSIDIAFSSPVEDWRTLLDVAVPAHVVGQVALGIVDPMEAKQAVIAAIQQGDPERLAAIAAAWNGAFAVDGSMAERLLVSSGPYQVTSIDSGGITLEANRRYTGETEPTIERVELASVGADALVTAIESSVDVIEVVPTAENFEAIRDLDRIDYTLAPASTGRLWTLQMRGDRGLLQTQLARSSLLHAIPRGEAIAAGGGPWANQLGSSDALLFPPHASDAYSVALEDSGFSDAWGTIDLELAALEREQAGVAAGTSLCVLYDRDEPFAAAAFATMAAGVAESGWVLQDCGTSDLPAQQAAGAWDAIITTVDVPETAAEVAAQWGTGGAQSLTGVGDPARDLLIAELATTTDDFAARDIRVDIEASIVAQAVALPLTTEPVVTLTAPGLQGVQPRPGPSARLTWSIAEWAFAEQ